LAKVFFDYYDVGDWKDKNGDKVKIWKQKFITWERNNPNNEKGATNDKSWGSTTGNNQGEIPERIGYYV
jgi:hypothetical protein